MSARRYALIRVLLAFVILAQVSGFGAIPTGTAARAPEDKPSDKAPVSVSHPAAPSMAAVESKGSPGNTPAKPADPDSGPTTGEVRCCNPVELQTTCNCPVNTATGDFAFTLPGFSIPPGRGPGLDFNPICDSHPA